MKLDTQIHFGWRIAYHHAIYGQTPSPHVRVQLWVFQ